jgi:glycosyltransferase involved in cell wall biosynthesis
MKLLILEDATEMGGVQHSTLNLLLGLKGDPNINAILLLPGEGTFANACREANISFTFYQKIPLFQSSISLWNDTLRLPNIVGLIGNFSRSNRQSKILLSVIRQFKPDVVLTKGMGAHLNGGRVCKKLDITCVWHQQDFISERYGGIYRWFFGKLALRYASYIIADGTPIRQQLPQRLQLRCSVVFNGVPLDQFYKPESRSKARAEFQIPENAYVIGHLARLTPWKGQHLLLQAFVNYAKENGTAHLILIGSPLFEGDNFLAHLQAQIQSAGLMGRVHLPGYRTDLGWVLSAIDTFIYPSVEKDTSPLALISAMAAGLPVGVSDIDGLREMVDGCLGAVLFENRSIREMENIMKHFESVELREQASELNRSWAQNYFSLAAYTAKMKDILTKIA